MLGKGHLSDFPSCLWNACHMHESLTHAIINFFNFYAAHLSFVTHKKATLLVDISLMIPPKRNINDVWLIFPVELFYLLGRVV